MKSTTKEHQGQCNFYEKPLNDFVFMQPRYFCMNGKQYQADTWVDLIDNLCAILRNKDANIFLSFLEDEKKRRTRIPYLSDTMQSIHYVKTLDKSRLYLNQKIDAPRSVKLVRKLLDKYGIMEDSFSICLKNRSSYSRDFSHE